MSPRPTRHHHAARIGVTAACIAFACITSCSDDTGSRPDAHAQADAPVTPDGSTTPDAATTPDATPGCEMGNQAPEVTIVFPPQGALTNADQVTIRGTAQDDGAIANIQIAGISAETDNAFAHWRAQVPLAPGDNQLVVTSSDTDGHTRCEAASIRVLRQQSRLVAPTAVALDLDGNRAFVIDADPDDMRVVAMELTNGTRAVVSDSAIGAGDPLTAPTAIAFDAASARLLMLDDDTNTLSSVDIATGDRTVLSSASVGSGPMFDTIVAIAVDGPRNRAIVLEQQNDVRAVLAVDLATGDRSVVSDATTGTGHPLAFMLSIAIDEAGARAFVGQSNGELLSIDLVTGDRSLIAAGTWYVRGIAHDPAEDRLLFISQYEEAILSVDLSSGTIATIADDNTGAGDDLQNPQGLALESTRGRALVIDTDARAVVSIDLATGDRIAISDIVLGTGPLPTNAGSVYIDHANHRLIFHDTSHQSLLAMDRVTGDREIVVDTRTMLPNLNVIWNLDAHDGRLFGAQGFSVPYLVGFDVAAGTFSVVSSNDVGAGPSLVNVRGLALDSTNNRALLSSRRTVSADDDIHEGYLHWVDLTTGDRTEVAGPGTGGTLTSPYSLIIDGDRALVFDRQSSGHPSRIVAVDLTTGTGTTLSGDGVGNGFELADHATFGMVHDVEGNRLIAALIFNDDSLIEIDLDTGDRAVISDVNTGRGPTLSNPYGLALSEGDDVVFIGDRGIGALVAIDLTTGERVIVSR